ncbi:MAG TPA: archease [Anaerolineales bacterium]
MDISAGYREIEHTADWELEVWAPDMQMLFELAARGMYSLAAARLQAGPRLIRSLELTGRDPEMMLVSFLGELLFLGVQEGIGFDAFDLQFGEHALHARLGGAPLESQDKEIKAVTYHNLAIRKTARGLEVRIVFDV